MSDVIGQIGNVSGQSQMSLERNPDFGQYQNCRCIWANMKVCFEQQDFFTISTNFVARGRLFSKISAQQQQMLTKLPLRNEQSLKLNATSHIY